MRAIVLETVRYPTSDDEDAIVHYYGCDDFVLPSNGGRLAVEHQGTSVLAFGRVFC